MAISKLSMSANRRYITRHAFDMKPANVLPRRCKGTFTKARRSWLMLPSYSHYVVALRIDCG